MAFISVGNSDSTNLSLNPFDFNFNDEDWSTIVRERFSDLSPAISMFTPVSAPLKNPKHSWPVGLTLNRYNYLASAASSTSLVLNDASGFVAGDTVLVGGLGGTFTVVTAKTAATNTLTVEDSVTANKYTSVVQVGAAQVYGDEPGNWEVEEITEAYNYVQEYNRKENIAEGTRAKVQFYGMTNEQSIMMGMLKQAAVDMNRTLVFGERQAASNATTIPMAGGLYYLINTYASGNVNSQAELKWSEISTQVELQQYQGGFSGGKGIMYGNTKMVKYVHDLAVLNNASADIWSEGSRQLQQGINLNGVHFLLVTDPIIDAALRSGTDRTRTGAMFLLSPSDAAGNPNLKLMFDGVSPKDHVRVQQFKTHASAVRWEILSRFTIELGEPQTQGLLYGTTSVAKES